MKNYYLIKKMMNNLIHFLLYYQQKINKNICLKHIFFIVSVIKFGTRKIFG